MIKFKEFLKELKNPKEIGLFRKQISNVKKVDQRQEWSGNLQKWMMEHGFNFIGHGRYGKVFSNPKYKYAIKVFMKDTPYLKYINWVYKNRNNKYVPKLRGKIIKINKIIFAVRLEKLKEYDNSDIAFEFMDICRSPEDYLEGTLFSYGLFKNDNDLKDLAKFLAENRKVLDIHQGNIMMRGRTPVLIDPLYNYFRNQTFTMNQDDISRFEEIF